MCAGCIYPAARRLALMESRQRGAGPVGGLRSMSLLLYSCHCTANGHITCEAAAGAHVSNLGQTHAGALARVRGWRRHRGRLPASTSTFVWTTEQAAIFAVGAALRDH